MRRKAIKILAILARKDVDPAISSWVSKTLAGHEKAPPRVKAQILYQAIQTEFPTTPGNREFLRDPGIVSEDAVRFPRSSDFSLDEDERVTLLGAVMRSLGIKTEIVGRGYEGNTISHVLLRYKDENGNWLIVGDDLPHTSEEKEEI